MRKTSYVALTFILLLCVCISPSQANPQMKILSVGTIDYSSSGQIKILRQSSENWAWSASKFASIIDVYQGHRAAIESGIVGQIKAIRSNVLAFIYYNSIHVWCNPSHPEYEAAKLTLFKNNNWILRDIYNNYVTAYSGDAYYVDFGNPDYHTWLANWFKNYIDTYNLDGATIDNWFCHSAVWYYTSQTAVNPRTGNKWTNQEICNAFKALTLKVRQVLGANKLIHANAVWSGYHFYNPSVQVYYIDGILNGGFDVLLSEGWLDEHDASEWYAEDVWRQSIDFAVWLENNWNNGKYFQPVCTDFSFAWGNKFPSDLTEAQYEQYVTYCYASRLLTLKRLDTIIEFGFYIERAYPQSLFKINIGTPSESYHTLGTSHVYTRKFSGGMVLVNPTYNSYTVTIGSGYKNAVTGSTVSSTLTVQPHTGIILSTA